MIITVTPHFVVERGSAISDTMLDIISGTMRYASRLNAPKKFLGFGDVAVFFHEGPFRIRNGNRSSPGPSFVRHGASAEAFECFGIKPPAWTKDAFYLAAVRLPEGAELFDPRTPLCIGHSIRQVHRHAGCRLRNSLRVKPT